MIRLIGIDVDGTLLDTRGQMPQSNVDAIHEAVHAGMQVALATCRSYPFARRIADALPPTITLIVSNGAVERAMDGSRFARRLLDRGIARAVLDATRPFRHAAALVFDRDAERQVMFETMDWEHPGRKAYWARNQSLIAQSVPLEDALVEDPIQVMFNGGVEAMRTLVSELREEARDFAVSLTEYEHRDFSLIDVTAPTATKGRAPPPRRAPPRPRRRAGLAVRGHVNNPPTLEVSARPAR